MGCERWIVGIGTFLCYGALSLSVAQTVSLPGVAVVEEQTTELPASPAYDPLSDQAVTCEEMQKYPDLVFLAEGLDLGSGHGSPTEVDYSCKESLAQLAFLRELRTLAETIRGGGEPGVCTGTIVYAQWRYYHFRLLEAGFAPRKIFRHAWPRESTPTAAYFERWSYDNPNNLRLYRAYMQEVANVTPILAAHYVRTFGLRHDEAEELARGAIDIFTDWAAGSSPDTPENQRVVEIARIVRERVQLPKWVETADVAEARIALNIALLLDLPATQVVLLIERTGGLDYGAEASVSLAMGSSENVRLLLDRGADVNHQSALGKTPVFYAIERNDRKMVETLLARGAEVNHRYRAAPEDGGIDCDYNLEHPARTPLMHAAQHADVAMLELLLKAGAQLKDVDGKGFSALGYALAAGKEANSAYLRAKGMR